MRPAPISSTSRVRTARIGPSRMRISFSGGITGLGRGSILPAAVWLVLASTAAADMIGVPRIVDGDTIEIADQRIHLYGIDAPEEKQVCHTRKKDKPFPCGKFAARALSDLIAGQVVTCRRNGSNEANAPQAICYVGRIDLNEQMVLQGWALAFRKHSDKYAKAENAARRLNEGLWKHKFTPPWEWRKNIK